MAQDFWASSGYRLLARDDGRLRATDAWLAHLLRREELVPPETAGRRERTLHERLLVAPAAPVTAAEIDAIEDPDARDNWRHFLAFRAHVLAHATIDAAYVSLFRGEVPVAPFFVDLLAQLIVRDLLEGEADAWLARAGEMFFRLQRVATEDARVLCADAATIGMYADDPQVRMDVLNAENASFYFLRDELYSFLIDLTPGSQGALALARMLERWIARLTGVRTRIEPQERVQDERWRWHVGLDTESSAILDALYRGEEVARARLERLLLLFRLDFADAGDVQPDVRGRSVYLGLACREDRTLRMKPQNLLANLPLAESGGPVLR
jgi:hypothetical protein